MASGLVARSVTSDDDESDNNLVTLSKAREFDAGTYSTDRSGMEEIVSLLTYFFVVAEVNDARQLCSALMLMFAAVVQTTVRRD